MDIGKVKFVDAKNFISCGKGNAKFWKITPNMLKAKSIKMD